MIKKIAPRPAQEEILRYRQGTMGVSAVPGSGKTWTLSLMAAVLIEHVSLEMDQEILIVTLVNAAVNHFSQQIRQFLSARDLIPSLGYRVRTLHGLAHDIVRKRPELVGLDTRFQIIDEREAIRIRRGAVAEWLRSHPQTFEEYLSVDLNPKKRERLYRREIPDILDQIALQFIRSAKNYQLSPEDIFQRLSGHDLPLAVMGAEMYAAYQRDLSYRGAVDFDDLIRFALDILQLDEDLLERLRYQWPYILEDEAQDSSRMQENILDLLAGPPQEQNWVRVGDPNQAIYETFTTADPQYLLDFIQDADRSHTLPNSGRSTQSIMDLANYLARWTHQSHPEKAVRDALVPVRILPTPAGDLQGNPADDPDSIYLYEKDFSPAEELHAVALSVNRWIEENPQSTVAILVPRNFRGKALTDHLRDHFDLEVIEYLNSTITTRKTSGALVIVLGYLADPTAPEKLAKVYQVWRKEDQEDEALWQEVLEISETISQIAFPESFLSPKGELDWQDDITLQQPAHAHSLDDFRQIVFRWQRAVLLPIDQLILILARDLFQIPSELAIAHKLANFLRDLSNQHPSWSLVDLTDELRVLARNERRFFTFASDQEFHPDHHRGKVVVTTVHKSKGLEWDRVYLISANNFNFPANQPDDWFFGEKWFLKNQLNAAAESQAQFETLLENIEAKEYIPGEATLESRLEFVRERLRLFYVAITRARKELIVTWNTGKRQQAKPSAALLALQDFWNSRQHQSNS